MSKQQHPYDRYYVSLELALISKVEEFEVLGYGKATVESLWLYLTKKKWKKPNQDVMFFELVNDVLTVKPGEYMSFETVEAYRSPNWFTEVNENELNALLRPKK
jgi:hypothetical protein